MFTQGIFLLQAETQGPNYSFFILLIGMFAVFYFFIIRPQQKRQKEERSFRSELKKGDKVLTIGGAHGQILSVDESSALVRVDENVKIRFELSALRAPGSDLSTK